MERVVKHQKHAKLPKVDIGMFGRNEIGILGTNCNQIKQFVEKLIKQLDENLNVIYIDADHTEDKGSLDYDSWQDKVGYYHLSTGQLSKTRQQFLLQAYDLVLVNANHFECQRQIIIIDTKKEDSLKRRLNQLHDVLAIVYLDDEFKNFEWLQIGSNVPQIKVDQTETLIHLIKDKRQIPKLKALILDGGKSLRMGEKKSDIRYRGVAQQDYLKQVFSQMQIENYLSVADSSPDASDIVDTYTGLGPYGGILSAFRVEPNTAWLVIACDLPLITTKEIQFLIDNRNPNYSATCCYNPATDFPDPLFTIWEPKAYPLLLQYLAMGISCPRKILINENVHLIHLPDADVLKNANTPEERNQIFNILNP